MTIRVWQYLSEYAEEREEIHAAIEQVLSSGQLILGQSVQNFESEFAAYCGVGHGVGVDNGTNAIWLALRALGLQPGDEVITVANTAVPTVSAIATAGGVARFVDIDPQTYLLDASALEAAVTARSRAVVAVHLYGQCVDMAAVAAVAERHDLRVVEDCAQSHGARLGERVAGSMSDAAAFSFYPTKILGGYGDAGMVLTDDAQVAERLRRLRFYGMEDRYAAQEQGYNCRLDELHAEILRRKLTHLDAYVARRREIADRYRELLAGTTLQLPAVAAGAFHAYYLFVVRHSKRDAIISALKERQILVNISYPWPIHTMRGYRELGYVEGDLPETERAAQEIFSLPMYPSLRDAEVDEVASNLVEILAEL